MVDRLDEARIDTGTCATQAMANREASCTWHGRGTGHGPDHQFEMSRRVHLSGSREV